VIVQALDPALPARQLLHDDELRQLVETVRSLYAGSWDDMAEDIRRRSGGRPYCFRLAIDEGSALDWIERIQAYETARGERLVDAMPEQEA